MGKLFVSIIIPSYNSASTIGQAIKASLAQDYPENKMEIIVVDDGSTDNTRDVVKRYVDYKVTRSQSHKVTYLWQEKKGPAAARNRGWRRAKGDVIFFTDADCIPARDCLAVMTEDIVKKNIGVTAGTYGIKNRQSIVATSIHEEIMFRHLRMPNYINSFGTYNVLIKRSILNGLGGFNENYLSSSAEDSDLSYRIIAKGYKIYFEKQSAVLHFYRENLYGYLKNQFKRAFWAMELCKHHPIALLNDYYTHWKDFIEVPLAILLIMAILFSWNVMFMITVLMYLFIEAVIPFSVYLKKRDVKLFLMLLVMMSIRTFVRMLGGIAGLIWRVGGITYGGILKKIL